MPQTNSDLLRENVLTLLRGKLTNPSFASSLMKQIANEMLRAVNKNFDEGGRPAWTPLAKSTIRERIRQKYIGAHGDLAILQRTRQLRKSVQATWDQSSATVSTNKEYAAIHQYGGVMNVAAHTKDLRFRTDSKGNLLHTEYFKGKGLIFAKKKHNQAQSRQVKIKAYSIRIPARPFLKLTDEDMQQINNIVLGFLVK